LNGSGPFFLERSGNSRWNSLNLRFPNVCCVAPGLNVGYVTGSGDEVPQALENLGLKVPFLSSADLASGNLARFHAILLGVRAYAFYRQLPERVPGAYRIISNLISLAKQPAR